MSDFKRYVSTAQVDARQLDEDETVVTAGGPHEASKGDYAVRHQDGTVTVATAEEFEEDFRPASAATSRQEKGTGTKGTPA